MSPRTAKLLSRGLIVLALLMVVAAFAAGTATAGHSVTAPIVVGDPNIADGPAVLADIQMQISKGGISSAGVNLLELLVVAIALLWLVTGSLIVSRQPRNFAGWLLMAIGMGWCLSAASSLLAWSLIAGGRLPLRGVFAVLGDTGLAPVLLAPLLFLLFPDGKPPSPRWRFLVWTLLGGAAIWTVGYVLSPGPLNSFVGLGILYVNPIGIRALAGVAPTLTAIGAITIIFSAIATVPAVRGRYKRSTGEERQQLKWLVAVATLAGSMLSVLVLLIGIHFAINPQGGDSALSKVLYIGLFVGVALTLVIGIPGSYLVAILKHGLWDLGVVIKKARIALTLTLLIAVPTVLFIAIASSVLLWNATTKTYTLVGGVFIGLLLIPVIRWERKVARRISFGKRATPYQVLTEFSGRVGETYSTDDVLPRMAQILAGGTGAVSARVLLRVGAVLREEASFGPAGAGEEHTVPVLHHGDDLGALAVTMPASDPMNPAKERLIEDLAAQAGPVLRNVRLIEDLRSSRQRLVAAQDEERRKLERNIHDGAQQQLVALAVKLRLAQGLVTKDPPKAEAMLADLQTETHDALEDLRDLARGIYPPLLADKGLPDALTAQARRSAIPVQVEADGVGRYPQDIESAVYFCTLEALNNVAKYAGTSNATVRLAQDNGHLSFTVTDDGQGFDPSATGYGTGLQGMADRLDAIGGDLRVESRPGAGTSVTGTVPTQQAGGIA